MKKFVLGTIIVLMISCAMPVDTGNAPDKDNSGLPVPGALTVTVTSLSSITVSWNPVSNAASYSVFRSLNGEDDSFSRVKVTGDTSWTDTGLTAGAVYYYQVAAALNNAGEGGRSAVVSARPMLPPAPLNVRAEAIPAEGITVSWNAALSADTYTIYRATSAGGSFDVLRTALTETVYTDSDITVGNEYFYKVTGVNVLGEGALSLHTSEVMAVLPAPVNVRGETVSAGEIIISWNAVQGASTYRIYRAANAIGTYDLLPAVSGLNYTDNTVTVGNEYFYKVTGVNKFGEGAMSLYAAAATTLPLVPQGANAAAVSESGISVSWNAVPGAKSYNLYRADNSGGPFSPLVIITAPAESYVDTALNSATQYFYTVAAINGIGEGQQSTAVSAFTKLPPPQTINAAPDSASSIAVSWSAVTGAMNYNVYRSTVENGTYERIGTSAATSYTDTISDTFAHYYYKVSAVNEHGESAQSVSAGAAFVFPGAPSGLTAVPQSATSLSVSWNAVPGASGYKLYYSTTTATGTYRLLDSVTSTSYTHSGLTINTDYWYKVSAVNIIGEGTPSASVNGRIAPPATPANVRVTPLSHTSIRISWDPVPGAMLYTVYRSSNSISSTTETSYVHTGLNPFYQYSYKVSATNDIGTGPLTTTAVSAYTQPRPLEEGIWYSRRNTAYHVNYDYYSFPVNGGTYYIQWGNAGHTGEAYTGGSGYYNRVSAYWKNTNSMTELSTSYFTDQTGGYATPRQIQAPGSGYIIILVKSDDSSYYNYDIRFYRE